MPIATFNGRPDLLVESYKYMSAPDKRIFSDVVLRASRNVCDLDKVKVMRGCIRRIWADYITKFRLDLSVAMPQDEPDRKQLLDSINGKIKVIMEADWDTAAKTIKGFRMMEAELAKAGFMVAEEPTHSAPPPSDRDLPFDVIS